MLRKTAYNELPLNSVGITGDISAELSFGTFDELLAAAFYGEWAGDQLTIGEKRTTFSIAKGYRDIGVYALFKGAHVSTMALEIPGEQPLACHAWITKTLKRRLPPQPKQQPIRLLSRPLTWAR